MMAHALLIGSRRCVVGDGLSPDVVAEESGVVMEKRADFVFNFPVDETTVDSIQSLRNIRLGLARQMAGSIEKTVDEMIRRGLVHRNERSQHMHALKSHLAEKIAHLQKRGDDSDSIYSDELELYLGLMADPAEELTQEG